MGVVRCGESPEARQHKITFSFVDGIGIRQGEKGTPGNACEHLEDLLVELLVGTRATANRILYPNSRLAWATRLLSLT